MHMIQCSPQQIIAESLRDCYRFQTPSQQLPRFTSPSNKTTPLYSPRQFQKKSLKKISSLNRIETNSAAQSYFDTRIQNKRVVEKQNEYQIRNKMSCNYNIIENKKYQVNYNAEIETKPRIYISYKSPTVNKVRQHQKESVPVYLEPFNVKQTFCASTEIGSHQASLFTSHLPESSELDLKFKQISNFNVHEDNIKEKIETKSTSNLSLSPFRLLNPKLAVSRMDNEQVQQEQHSQILWSYIKRESSQ